MEMNEQAIDRRTNNVSNEAKYQIFISSTYIDLKDERQHAIREVIRAEQFPIAMENFVASGNNQWKTIERFLKNSGCVILILGKKYGIIDENDDQKRSFTEKEFDFADKLGLPILAFILSENECQHNACKNDEENEKHMNFKRKIEANRLVCFFRDGAELSGAIAHSIAIEKSSFKNPWYRDNDTEYNAPYDETCLSSIPNFNYWNEDALKMFNNYEDKLDKLTYKWDENQEWEGGKDFKYLFEIRSDRQMINDELKNSGITKSFRYVYPDKKGIMRVKGWYL